MKRSLFCAAAILFLAAFAQAAGPVSAGDAIIEQMVPQCTGTKLNHSPMKAEMPAGMTAESYTLESNDPYCRFDGVRVSMPDGRFFVGQPWPIGSFKGTVPERIKAFAYQNMQLSLAVEPAGTDGTLQKLKVYMVTEAGRIPLDGFTDAAGTTFFMGDVSKSADDLLAKRSSRLAPIVAQAPSLGPKDAPVTIIEFSDFECPSCKEAHKFIHPLLDKYKGRIRYVRVDMPLVSGHPWAFAASVIGRAVWRQSPDAFWDWKNSVYENQAELNAFVLDDFGRNFAKDHSLDMAKYDADIASEEIRRQILEGVGAAFTLQIQATPSYMVNGRFVAGGKGGHNLASYLEGLFAAAR